MSITWDGNTSCYSRGCGKSVLLELSPHDEQSLALLRSGQLLKTPKTFEPLQCPAPGEHDVHFEAISDLGNAGRVSESHVVCSRRDDLTSMWRSVAPVNESITSLMTSGSGRCFGCDVPGAGC
jgi:hypothetical protein